MDIEDKVLEFQKTGDSSLGKEIFNRSYELANTIINSKYTQFGYYDDLLSESHDAIIAAVYAFKADAKVKFNTFCSVCINNRILNFIKKQKRAEQLLLKKPLDFYETECRVDAITALSTLSSRHRDSLLHNTGSRSMKFRAKKAFFKNLNS
jgi:DNA-directed RNA polymerase specialized sigma subunit